MDNRRRRLLRTAGIALAAGVAGCAGDDGSGSGDGESTDPETTPTDAPEPTATPTATSTATPTPGDDGYGGYGDDTAEAPTATQTPTATPAQGDTQTATPTPAVPTVDLVVTNDGASAWELVSDESGAVGPTGEDNPTLTFQVGTRYVVANRGWGNHPFALRASDDSPLLSQGADGSYESDGEVNWVDNGDSFAFTTTEALAAEVDSYVCTIHSLMEGDVATE